MNPLYLKIAGATTLGIATAFLVHALAGPFFAPSTDDHAVHVHADFLIAIQGERIDLSDDAYQSVAGHPHHESIHIHDNVGHVLHRHADDVTFADFLSSIGFTLTDDTFTTDDGRIYGTTPTERLLLFVNGEVHHTPSTYVTEENDRILLYYGNPESPDIATYLDEITDDACIYSGTCPERGVPPPESCGITCEI